jgi:putative PIN family toxin of toxin-antitoxin system
MKRVMFDTNIIISAILSDRGKPSQSILLAYQQGYDICICSAIRDEVLEKFEQKWPEYLEASRVFLNETAFTDVLDSSLEAGEDFNLRDVDDLPIYRAALAAEVDYLITGDKDLLEFKESSIKIIKAADFIETHASRM